MSSGNRQLCKLIFGQETCAGLDACVSYQKLPRVPLVALSGLLSCSSGSPFLPFSVFGQVAFLGKGTSRQQEPDQARDQACMPLPQEPLSPSMPSFQGAEQTQRAPQRLQVGLLLSCRD